MRTIYAAGEDGLAHKGIFRGMSPIPIAVCTETRGTREIRTYRELVVVWKFRLCPVCFPDGFPEAD